MGKIKRYDLKHDKFLEIEGMCEKTDGEYVKYEDYVFAIKTLAHNIRCSCMIDITKNNGEYIDGFHSAASYVNREIDKITEAGK